MVATLWKTTSPETILGEYSGSALLHLYYDEVCCCNVGADCSGKCQSGTTPLEVDVTINQVPVDIDFCSETENCDWLEGQTFRLQQDAVDECKYCITLEDWCEIGTDLEICFFFWLQGGTPDRTMGRLQFKSGGNTTQVEWEIGTAPIHCTNYVETVTSGSTNVSYGSNNETTCDWFGAITGRSGWSYTVDAV